jgi:hypothetical protein
MHPEHAASRAGRQILRCGQRLSSAASLPDSGSRRRSPDFIEPCHTTLRRGGSVGRALGSRDQVRRLPHAGAPATRAACHLPTGDLRLEAALPDHRRCARVLAGQRTNPGWRSRGRRLARRPRLRTAARRSRGRAQGPAALLCVRPCMGSICARCGLPSASVFSKRSWPASPAASSMPSTSSETAPRSMSAPAPWASRGSSANSRTRPIAPGA